MPRNLCSSLLTRRAMKMLPGSLSYSRRVRLDKTFCHSSNTRLMTIHSLGYHDNLRVHPLKVMQKWHLMCRYQRDSSGVCWKKTIATFTILFKFMVFCHWMRGREKGHDQPHHWSHRPPDNSQRLEPVHSKTIMQVTHMYVRAYFSFNASHFKAQKRHKLKGKQSTEIWTKRERVHVFA